MLVQKNCALPLILLLFAPWISAQARGLPLAVTFDGDELNVTFFLEGQAKTSSAPRADRPLMHFESAHEWFNHVYWPGISTGPTFHPDRCDCRF